MDVISGLEVEFYTTGKSLGVEQSIVVGGPDPQPVEQPRTDAQVNAQARLDSQGRVDGSVRVDGPSGVDGPSRTDNLARTDGPARLEPGYVESFKPTIEPSVQTTPAVVVPALTQGPFKAIITKVWNQQTVDLQVNPGEDNEYTESSVEMKSDTSSHARYWQYKPLPAGALREKEAERARAASDRITSAQRRVDRARKAGAQIVAANLRAAQTKADEANKTPRPQLTKEEVARRGQERLTTRNDAKKRQAMAPEQVAKVSKDRLVAANAQKEAAALQRKAKVEREGDIQNEERDWSAEEARQKAVRTQSQVEQDAQAYRNQQAKLDQPDRYQRRTD